MNPIRRDVSLDAIALCESWLRGDQEGRDAILGACDLEHARRLAAFLAGGLVLEADAHHPGEVERILANTRALVFAEDQDDDQ